DAIPPGMPGLCDAGGADQRGQPRPQGFGCEIGSVEGDSGVVKAGADFVVNDAGDAPGAALGDAPCHTTSGTCPLRAAVQQLDQYAGLDSTITIAPGIDPTLSITGAGEDQSATGDLDLRNDVTITGSGSTITGTGSDRIFDVGVDGTAPTVSLMGV